MNRETRFIMGVFDVLLQETEKKIAIYAFEQALAASDSDNGRKIIRETLDVLKGTVSTVSMPNPVPAPPESVERRRVAIRRTLSDVVCEMVAQNPEVFKTSDGTTPDQVLSRFDRVLGDSLAEEVTTDS